MTIFLSVGDVIKNPACSGEYTIEEIIGRGSSTIAYRATYKERGVSSCRILKEFYPIDMGISRNADGALLCPDKNAEKFAQKMLHFQTSGKRQQELRNRACLMNETPHRNEMFTANNTFYIDVIPYQGRTFDHIETFSLIERLKLCLAIAKLISSYHNEGLLFLDIKPENLFILTNSSGEAVTDLIEIIDFDSVIEKENIAFGTSLSFTEEWAAPEQIDPYSYSLICEATDIYILGELVFWCIFGRHSAAYEHRSFSSYPFDQADPQFSIQLERREVQRLLESLFRKTLRSSVQSRFTCMESVIDLLNQLVDKVSEKQFVIDSMIRVKEVFVGRDQEMNELHAAMQSHDMVFVHGIAGIGKSEFVRQYARLHQPEYDHVLYWTYDGDLDSMICNDDSVSIAHFSRFPDESDAAYCCRKLNVLKSMLRKNTLIVIDNIDLLVDELKPSEVWRSIKSLPGKLLIVTRCEEYSGRQIRIHEIRDIAALRRLFFAHCPAGKSVPDQVKYIDRIIEIANYHTYEIELLAAYTREKGHTPQDTLSEMETAGFSCFGNTKIAVFKDNLSAAETYHDHLKKLFFMTQMSDSQQQLLLKLSFLPTAGIQKKQFNAFYSLEDLNDLNWLIHHGFVSESHDLSYTVSVHPSVAQMMIDIAKKNAAQLETFYEDAFVAMLKGVDDPSVRDRLAVYEKSMVSRQEYRDLCKIIVEKTLAIKIDCTPAARYITQYVECFSKYGSHSLQKLLLQYAINVYDKHFPTIYAPDKEYACFIYSDILMAAKVHSLSDLEKVTTFCIEHLRKAKKAKDWNMAKKWCEALVKLSFMSNRVYSAIKYSAIILRYINKSAKQKAPTHSFDATNYLIRLSEVNESMYELYKPRQHQALIWILSLAIEKRKMAIEFSSGNGPSENVIRIAINQARIYILQHQYSEAEMVIRSALDPFKRDQHPPILASVDLYELLGDVLITTKQFAKAIEVYREGLDLADWLWLNDDDTTIVKLKLGRTLNLGGEYEQAKLLNTSLIKELAGEYSDDRNILLADAYYNVGDGFFLTGNMEDAATPFKTALNLYETAPRKQIHANIGKARCYERLARIRQSQDDVAAGKELMQKAFFLLKDMLGTKHPEVIDFKNMLSTFEK